ncbi:MAG: ribonuclease D [Actinomycetota bacterium]|nr:ribonuclease D [Actinomycetota bacterium]MDP2288754.1 ribonuclease D [Actinomycetota bacterium]
METDTPPRAEREPRDGVPHIITTSEALQQYAAAVALGHGPVALDAERASGFRYSQRAYLIQVRREGAGTALIDPIAVPELSALAAAIANVPWILHAANQDLPCLAELGLYPSALFDTELAGRLLGRERVSLGALVESELGEILEKGHGATDWSIRPLTKAQLRYAALDVELLVELREVLEAELATSGKLEFAQQEFLALLAFTPRARGEEPWRRTSGIHRIRKEQSLAVVRELWFARDQIAQREDIASGRILPDAAIVAAAAAMPVSAEALGALPEFSGRGQTRRRADWWAAIDRALSSDAASWPVTAAPAEGPPPPRTWANKNPAAADRLERAREGLRLLSEECTIPVENLLTPELARRLCWDPPEPLAISSIQEQLRTMGARQWQIELTAPILLESLTPADSATTE